MAGNDGSLNLFALNRDLRQPMTIAIDARGFGNLAVSQALELRDDDLKAVNSKAAPQRIKPAPLTGVGSDGRKLRMTLAPASWNMIRLEPAR